MTMIMKRFGNDNRKNQRLLYLDACALREPVGLPGAV